jgi:hypothetical protein
MQLRTILKANEGETPDAQCAIKVENYLKAHGPAGEWMDFRELMKAVHYERFGPRVFEGTIKGLVSLKIAEIGERPTEKRRPAKTIRLVIE